MKTQRSNIEVELRGVMSESKQSQLLQFFSDGGVPVQKDDKISYFFVTDGFILKVTEDIDQNRAKITVKNGDETRNILEENEVMIDKKYVDAAVHMFVSLGYPKVNRVVQKRVNIDYKGAAISLKYSDDWGYHFEVEKMAHDLTEAEAAKLELGELCAELGLEPMNSDQIRQKIDDINRGHGFLD